MNKCPKCNGTSGFEYNLIMKSSRVGNWGADEDEETEIKRVDTPKTVTRIDCKKRIGYDAAHRWEEL